MESSRNEQSESRFGVIAEIDGRPRSVVQLKVPFGRLIDEIIVPYDNDQPFFIDGVTVTRKNIKRIKVVELGEAFHAAMREFENMLNRGKAENQKIWGDQYETRFEHILRIYTQDVTAQVLKAYSQAVKPQLKDYIPKREELISAATTIFVEAMKVLSR
jgi:hypothetical protein